jgi:hypothetical protein
VSNVLCACPCVNIPTLPSTTRFRSTCGHSQVYGMLGARHHSHPTAAEMLSHCDTDAVYVSAAEAAAQSHLRDAVRPKF